MLLQVILTAREQDLEAIEQILFDCGAISITFQDSEDRLGLEPAPGEMPFWSRITVTSLFAANFDTLQIRLSLRAALGKDFKLRFERVADKDWTQTWMANFNPMRFGERLWICPSWQSHTETGSVVISLDPGLAFGTGTHPTTALCLEWLDAHPPFTAEVVDYGCGSGVLAIAALKLGARHVWAVDIDPQALLATHENALKNKITISDLDIIKPEHMPELQVDLVIANILSAPLIELSQRIAGTIKQGGTLVLSGILSEQAEKVIKAYSNHFKMRSPLTKDEWVLLEGHRK